MRKFDVAVLAAVLLLPGCGAKAPECASRADRIMAELQDNSSEKVFVVSHRGDWRNYPENSIPAIESVIRMGVDIVEMDVRMTEDSVLVLCHDRTVDRCTDGSGPVDSYTYGELMQLRLKRAHGVVTDSMHICSLREALECCRDRIVVNVDKGYEYYDMVLAVAEEAGVADQILIKGKKPVEDVAARMAAHEDNLMYMPIIDILEPEGKALLDEYMRGEAGMPVAFELCWSRMTPEVEDAMEKIVHSGSRLWVNTIWGSLCGYLDDDAALACGNPAEIYDQVIALGATMIQTDRPEMLLGYLRSKGLHE